MTDEELSISDATLIARLREARKKQDGFEAVMLSDAAADRIEALLQAVRHANDHADVAIADMQSAEDRIEALVKELTTIAERLAAAGIGVRP
jgi:predicted  nucleic acid-binding Zn-ribbon protein